MEASNACTEKLSPLLASRLKHLLAVQFSLCKYVARAKSMIELNESIVLAVPWKVNTLCGCGTFCKKKENWSLQSKPTSYKEIWNRSPNKNHLKVGPMIRQRSEAVCSALFDGAIVTMTDQLGYSPSVQLKYGQEGNCSGNRAATAALTQVTFLAGSPLNRKKCRPNGVRSETICW